MDGPYDDRVGRAMMWDNLPHAYTDDITTDEEIGVRAAHGLWWENHWARDNVANLMVRGWISEGSWARYVREGLAHVRAS